MDSKKITIDTYEIEYVRSGTGQKDTIVFAHGLGGNMDQWKLQFQHFKNDYDVIAFSLQGHGNSSTGSSIGDYSIQKYCDVALQLLGKLSIEECIWIGNSMGGVIGFEVMKQSPTIIRKLIVNGTTPKLKYSSIGLKTIYIMDKVLIRILGYERYVDIAVKASLKDTRKMAWLKELFMAARPEAIIMSHQLLGDYDYSKVIEKTPIPIVFLTTPNDTAINKHLEKTNSWLNLQKNVTIEVKSIGGHLVNMEYPDEYNCWLKGLFSTK